jgi:hypothetical protein
MQEHASSAQSLHYISISLSIISTHRMPSRRQGNFLYGDTRLPRAARQPSPIRTANLISHAFATTADWLFAFAAHQYRINITCR